MSINKESEAAACLDLAKLSIMDEEKDPQQLLFEAAISSHKVCVDDLISLGARVNHHYAAKVRWRRVLGKGREWGWGL